MGIEPIHGNTQISSRRMTLLEYPGAQLGENFSNHSRAMASKVSPPVIFSARRFAAGSIPFLRSRLASSLSSRAFFSGTSGKTPKLSNFSRPWTRNLRRHQRLPIGLTSRYRPPPSLILKGFSRGLAAEIAAFVSISGGNTFWPWPVTPTYYPHLGLAVNGSDRTSIAQKLRKKCGISALGGSQWTSLDDEMVAREGIEPPTRGFAVPAPKGAKCLMSRRKLPQRCPIFHGDSAT